MHRIIISARTSAPLLCEQRLLQVQGERQGVAQHIADLAERHFAFEKFPLAAGGQRWGKRNAAAVRPASRRRISTARAKSFGARSGISSARAER